jgi:hypothetical protein
MTFVGTRMIVFGVVFLGVVGLSTFALWNALMPSIFGLPPIGFWQAVGLLILGRLLFGSFGGWGHRMRKARFVRGWGHLTPEERQRFRHAMGSRCAPNFGEGAAAEEPPAKAQS